MARTPRKLLKKALPPLLLVFLAAGGALPGPEGSSDEELSFEAGTGFDLSSRPPGLVDASSGSGPGLRNPGSSASPRREPRGTAVLPSERTAAPAEPRTTFWERWRTPILLSAAGLSLLALATFGPGVLLAKLDHLAIFGAATFLGQLLLRGLGVDGDWVDGLTLSFLAIFSPLAEFLQPLLGGVLPFLAGAFQASGIVANVAGGLLGIWAGGKVYEWLKGDSRAGMKERRGEARILGNMRKSGAVWAVGLAVVLARGEGAGAFPWAARAALPPPGAGALPASVRGLPAALTVPAPPAATAPPPAEVQAGTGPIEDPRMDRILVLPESPSGEGATQVPPAAGAEEEEGSINGCCC